MDKYQLLLARLEQEEDDQWIKLSLLIQDIDSSDDDSECAEIRGQLETYRLTRNLLREARLIGTNQPIALLPGVKEA